MTNSQLLRLIQQLEDNADFNCEDFDTYLGDLDNDIDLVEGLLND